MGVVVGYQLDGHTVNSFWIGVAVDDLGDALKPSSAYYEVDEPGAEFMNHLASLNDQNNSFTKIAQVIRDNCRLDAVIRFE